MDMNSEIYEDVYYCMWCGYFSKKSYIKCPKCGHKDIEKVNLEYTNHHKSAIIKISSIEILENIRSGSIWFQSGKFYREYTGKGYAAIADPTDGMCSNNNEDSRTYRYMSLYSLDIDDNHKIIKERSQKLKEFGDYFTVINIYDLIKELKNYFMSRNIQASSYFIKYSCLNKYATYNLTCKNDKYLYQNEFRIILFSKDFLLLGEKEPFKTDKTILNLQRCFSKPIHINDLLSAKTLDDINIDFS